MFFFDYVFYKVYKYGQRVGEGDVYSYTVIVISLLQGIHIFSFFLLLDLSSLMKFPFKGYKVLILGVLPLVFNFWKYNRKYQSKLEEKFSSESDQVKKFKGVWVLAYVVCSIVIWVSLASYLGHLNNS